MRRLTGFSGFSRGESTRPGTGPIPDQVLYNIIQHLSYSSHYPLRSLLRIHDRIGFLGGYGYSPSFFYTWRSHLENSSASKLKNPTSASGPSDRRSQLGIWADTPFDDALPHDSTPSPDVPLISGANRRDHVGRGRCSARPRRVSLGICCADLPSRCPTAFGVPSLCARGICHATSNADGRPWFFVAAFGSCRSSRPSLPSLE